MNSAPSIRRPELVLPFAAVGLIGGWFVAACLRADPDPCADPWTVGPDLSIVLGWGLILVTPIVAGLLGWMLGKVVRRRPIQSVPLAIAAIALAGAVNGEILGILVAGGREGLEVGLLYGALFSLPFMPALVSIVFAARHVGRSRPRSLLDGSDRRYVWSVTVTATAVTFAVFIASLGRRWHETSSSVRLLGVGVIAFAPPILLGLILCDGLAFLRARHAAKEAEASSLVPAELLETPKEILDFGIGEGTSGRASVGSYRLPEHVRAVFSGDPRAARAYLRRRLIVSLIGLALGTCAAFLATWRS